MDSKLNLTSLRDKISSKMSESMKKSKGKEDKKEKKKEENRAKNTKDKDAKDKKERAAKDKKAGDKKAGDKKAGDKKAGDKKAGDKKAGDKKAGDKKAYTQDSKHSQKSSKKTNSSGDDDITEVLRREALALGASEADLDLLAGVSEGEESEQEFQDSKGLQKGFGDDLRSFMKGIGLGQGDVMVVDDDEVPELVEVEQPEEEEEEEDEEEEEEEEETEEEEKEEEEEKNEKTEDKQESESSDSSDAESSDESEDESEDEKESEPVHVKEVNFKTPNPDKVTSLQSVSSTNLIVPARTDWFNTPLDSPHDPSQPAPAKLDRFGRERLLDRAKSVIDKDNKTYLAEFTSQSSQKKFLSQILSDGTLNDKISALTLLVQESPFHNLKAFETLLGYCEKKSRTASLQSINAIKDLLLNGVLPDRKLVAFENQPLTPGLSDTQVALYYFEDWVKKAYFKLISILEVLSHDPILHVRMTVISHLFELLKMKPEQEFNLLRLGVNKLGDIDNKVCSKTSYQILQLETHHPAMKSIIVDAVIDTIFKSNNDYNAKYYSVITLNQTILLRQDEDLANQLVKTYFKLFESLLKEADDAQGPKEGDKVIGESTHGRNNGRKNFKKGKKGGKSVKVEEKTQFEIVEERNTKLFSALLTGLNRAFPFSNLPAETFEQHLNTLFKITHSKNFNTSVQALGLIHHIVTKQGLNTDRYFKTLYESLLDQRLVQSSKQGIYLNLLFKSLKNDTDTSRVLAFVKRILQACSHWLNIGSVSGMLFLLIELSKEVPEINEMMAGAVKTEEKAAAESKEDEESKEKDKAYDPRKRDPKFANAKSTPLYELTHFLNHYHPTVAIYASSLLDGTPQQKPDLGLYTLAHFLDRFVYKNSKQKAVTKGSSIMQPLGGAHTGSLLVKATNVLSSEIPANTENWANKKIADVRPDEKFFHQYFTSKITKIKSKKEDAEELDEEEAEQLEDKEVWQALVKSRPDVEAGSEDDMSDFDEADFDDMSDFDDEDEEGEGEEAAEGDDDNEEAGEAAEFDEPDFEEEFGKLAQEEDPEDVPFDDQENEMFGINEEDELSDSEVEANMDTGSKKRKSDDDSKKSKKAKLKSLPVFASADDYAQYLDSDDEDFS